LKSEWLRNSVKKLESRTKNSSMTCTTAVFTLMMGAAILACAALFSYFMNNVGVLKNKMSSLNSALTAVQEEKSQLVAKTECLNNENNSQSIEIERLMNEINQFKPMVERLEKDNRILMKEYFLLENQRKEAI
jgi:peptidoglycan hydrolase CwlO-like protein